MMKFNLEDLLEQAEEGYFIPCHDDQGNVDLFAKSSSGDTLLHVAVGQNDKEAVLYLVSKKLDINSRGDYMATPLFVAASSGNIEMISLLLKLGSDYKIPDHTGDLPSDVLFRYLKKKYFGSGVSS